jgi:hypothetical protein
MANVIDQLNKSNFSLDGPSGLSARNFGYFSSKKGEGDVLHNTYSIFTDPSDLKLSDFNGNTSVKPESNLDETDPIAPNNFGAGKVGSVVSEVYKSTPGKTYKDLGPQGGHF